MRFGAAAAEAIVLRAVSGTPLFCCLASQTLALEGEPLASGLPHSSVRDDGRRRWRRDGYQRIITQVAPAASVVVQASGTSALAASAVAAAAAVSGSLLPLQCESWVASHPRSLEATWLKDVMMGTKANKTG